MKEATKNSLLPPARRWAGRLLLWAAALGILAWLFRHVPPAEMLKAAGRTRPWFFAGVILGFSVVTLFLDSAAHFWAFRRFNPPVRFGPVFRARAETYLFLAMGFLYGQGGMAWAAGRKLGKPFTEITSSVLFLTFNNLVAMMLFPTIALLFFIEKIAASDFSGTSEGKIILRWLFISWPLCLLAVLFFARKWDNPLRRRLSGGLSLSFDQAGPGDYAAALALRGVQIIMWCVFSWLGLRACRVEISLTELFLLGPIIGLAAAIPTPGRLGTSQGAWVLMFHHRADPAALIAFSLLWTVGVNLLRWFIGAVFLAWPGGEKSEGDAATGGQAKEA